MIAHTRISLAARRAFRRAPASIQRFRMAQCGVAAIEFAMILPIMLLMYLGMTEVTVAVNTDRKLTILSRTLADLTGRMPTIDNQQMGVIFGASLAVMAPYDHSNVEMRISSVVISDNSGTPQASVCWSDASGGSITPRAKDEIVPVPDGFDVPGTSFILAEVSKVYKPMLGHAITGDITLTEETPWPVRNVAEVTRGTTSCL